jgi:hypothetical protein
MSDSHHYSAKKAKITDFDVSDIKLQVQKTAFQHFWAICSNQKVESYDFDCANLYIAEQKKKLPKIFISFIHLTPDNEVDNEVDTEPHTKCTPERCSNGRCPLLNQNTRKNSSNIFVPKEVTFVAQLKDFKFNKCIASFSLEVLHEDNPGLNDLQNCDLFENLNNKNINWVDLSFSLKCPHHSSSSGCGECDKFHSAGHNLVDQNSHHSDHPHTAEHHQKYQQVQSANIQQQQNPQNVNTFPNCRPLHSSSNSNSFQQQQAQWNQNVNGYLPTVNSSVPQSNSQFVSFQQQQPVQATNFATTATTSSARPASSSSPRLRVEESQFTNVSSATNFNSSAPTPVSVSATGIPQQCCSGGNVSRFH